MYTLEWAIENMPFLSSKLFYRLLQAFRNLLTDDRNKLNQKKIDEYRDEKTGSTASLVVCKKIGEIIEDYEDICLDPNQGESEERKQ